MQIAPVNKTSFRGIVPPYKIKGGFVYPIGKCAPEKDILQLSKGINKLPIGEGGSGIVFDMRDFIVKIFKKTNSSQTTGEKWMQEVKNLDFLRNLCMKKNNPDYLHKTQKGFFGLHLRNKFFLVSSKVEGENPHPVKNKFNKENLASLMEIFERLDKGTGFRKFLHPDLRMKNVMITNNDAGLIDFGMLFKFKPSYQKTSDWVDKSELTKKKKWIVKHFTGDTGYMVSNLRSFEYDLFSPYLDYADKTEARRVFEIYMPLKADYHRKMSDFYFKEAEKTSKSSVKPFCAEELIHSQLLKELLDDIKEAEIDKLQMNVFLRKILNIFQSGIPVKMNFEDVTKYIDNSVARTDFNLQKAIELKDSERITYYNNLKSRTSQTAKSIYNSLKKLPLSKFSTSEHEVLLKNKLM